MRERETSFLQCLLTGRTTGGPRIPVVVGVGRSAWWVAPDSGGERGVGSATDSGGEGGVGRGG